MKISFELDLNSPEGYIGIGIGVLLLVLVWLLRRRDPGDSNAMIQNVGSPGAAIYVDQSKRTNVAIAAPVAVNVATTSRQPHGQSPADRSARNSSPDDIWMVLVLALFALAVTGVFYLRHFEIVTFVSRTICFVAATYAFLGFMLDLYARGWRSNEVQFGYLLAGLFSGAAAGLLLQAQELISVEMVQAAIADSSGAVNFFLNRLTSVGKLLLVASLLSTTVTSFIALVAVLVILRAIVTSWSDESQRSWVSTFFLKYTGWFRPQHFAILSIVCTGFVGLVLYVWLPHSLRA